jgi:hypothetical protein
MECLKNNVECYKNIETSCVTSDMSTYAFERDHTIYEVMPNEHKTKEMTLRYLSLTDNKDFSKYIPTKFLSIPIVLDRVIRVDGARLAEAEFKNKTYTICNVAVTNNGCSLEHVPFSVVDFDLCDKAVTNTPDAYIYVPHIFKTVELKELLVDKHLSTGFQCLQFDEVTHKMLMTIIKKVGHEFAHLNFDNKNIKSLLAAHMKEYIECDYYTIATSVPSKLISDDLALEIVKKDEKLVLYFSDKSNEFLKESVKIGAHFSNLPIESITLSVLSELVTARATVIDELSPIYISDDLYIICMKTHGYKLSQIPDEYKTFKLLSVAFELYPEEGHIKLDDIDTNTSVESLETKKVKVLPLINKTNDSVQSNEDDKVKVITTSTNTSVTVSNNDQSNDTITVDDLI